MNRILQTMKNQWAGTDSTIGKLFLLFVWTCFGIVAMMSTPLFYFFPKIMFTLAGIIAFLYVVVKSVDTLFQQVKD